MVQSRKDRKAAAEKSPGGIELAHPDKSGPTEKTLLDWASERKLFDEADARQRTLGGKKGAKAPPPPNQSTSGRERRRPQQQPSSPRRPIACSRPSSGASAFFTPLFYILHPHPSSPTLVPVVPKRYQEPIRQTIFFAVSVAAGCHLIKITNTYGYISVMKRSPPLGCLWVWSVIELNLLPATASVVIALAYLWLGFR
ncbi:hypothetical protein PG997_015306 [Apiospora hydei]|uniref:DUF7719 domain-containing protein n=1 Tax=Apiospora hydei TaxID=1337664 RepID=A0ABR1UST9_9PEZI